MYSIYALRYKCSLSSLSAVQWGEDLIPGEFPAGRAGRVSRPGERVGRASKKGKMIVEHELVKLVKNKEDENDKKRKRKRRRRRRRIKRRGKGERG